jgi:hypothetical protein
MGVLSGGGFVDGHLFGAGEELEHEIGLRRGGIGGVDQLVGVDDVVVERVVPTD